jgi:hypothetical protein
MTFITSTLQLDSALLLLTVHYERQVNGTNSQLHKDFGCLHHWPNFNSYIPTVPLQFLWPLANHRCKPANFYAERT